MFDLLRRVLEANNLSVTYARNITDIDDKIIKKAAEQAVGITDITDKFTEAYHNDMAQLGIERPTLEPKATESLEAMFELIQKLIDNGHAYQIDSGDVYFDTQSDQNYLSISGNKQNENSSPLKRVTSASMSVVLPSMTTHT